MRRNRLGNYKRLGVLLFVTVMALCVAGYYSGPAFAQNVPPVEPSPTGVVADQNPIEVVSPYFSIQHTTAPDGRELSGYIINGPPNPPPGFGETGTGSSLLSVNAKILPDFPSYSWVFGCSAVSGSMIAGYYDRNGYPNMYTGPTNSGLMPVSDTEWSTWSDGTDTYPNNPLIASHSGVDGRVSRGSIDDYWVQYGSPNNDPYITGGWQQHAWGNAIGDYMKTSQSTFSNVDGSTTFFNWNGSSDKLTCSDMENLLVDLTHHVADLDGTYGRKLFYEARGYTVTDCYNQNTDKGAGGFSLANFQAEIDAGNPVLLNLAGHSIVGYGYDGSTIYIRDTWDNIPSNTHTMPWGGSYGGMALLSVSVVHINHPTVGIPYFMPLVIKSFPLNQPPTNILLSNSSIQENLQVNSLVGNLSSVDPNPGDTFTYSLVSGAGDAGNGAFNISGNQLRSSIIFDYDLQNSFSIRVRTTDQGGQYYEKAFIISITPVVGWETLVNTTFEGDFPGLWDVFDNNGVTSGDYYWKSRNCRPYAGTNSGWAVGGGTNGNQLSCGSNYPDNADSWMKYGPFSLVNATAARMDFKLWANTESGYDFMIFAASTDGQNFNGVGGSGATSGWMDQTLDLSDVNGLGEINLLGQPQVWVAIIFTSDETVNYSEGGYVDNVVLRRCMVTSCQGINSATPEISGSQFVVTPWAGTIIR